LGLLQQFAKELVATKPDLILSANTPTTAALLQQTRTIPIIFANVSDPVGDGFLTSLPRPVEMSPASAIWKPQWRASGSNS
jgi:putative ABC transport system substrate-binding protein